MCEGLFSPRVASRPRCPRPICAQPTPRLPRWWSYGVGTSAPGWTFGSDMESFSVFTLDLTLPTVYRTRQPPRVVWKLPESEGVEGIDSQVLRKLVHPWG